MSLLKVVCLCLVVLAVCGPIALAGPVEKRSAYDYVDDSDLVAKTPRPSNANKDGNQRFFGGAYKAGYGAFRG
ncbi:hypothetical protein DAPPUDRAFT_320558 [Daphnia pulex]|uniref:Uncharacterized protein n=1 Tax=Daphnia pulex TaxID=6669 RepID=E9GQD6_DAPPU|nr:hypothetical protein DAPPUDRAFT_335204 [Daphnia pulex]EFX78361.1 hypothetical protein DAPPUDRAFT_320558 [Daphnia pulex]|eukprot:EFX63659.1 hypothetical protein DAPPUDRAFT_335204 [Daphnia pulex]